MDDAGNIFIGDSANHTIRKITADGLVSTFAGLAGNRGSADGTGDAARFYYPGAVVLDSAQSIYVSDSWNHTIRKITPQGAVTTFAGAAGQFGSADGVGSAARFYYPGSSAMDSAGNIYVVDSVNYSIRKITPGAVVTTLAAGQAFRDPSMAWEARRDSVILLVG